MGYITRGTSSRTVSMGRAHSTMEPTALPTLAIGSIISFVELECCSMSFHQHSFPVSTTQTSIASEMLGLNSKVSIFVFR